jgi:hypothetical protein
MTEIFKHKIPQDILTNGYLEPGSTHGNKVSLLNENTMFVADRQTVFHVDMDSDVDVASQRKLTKNEFIPFPIPLASIQVTKSFSIDAPNDACIQNITLDRKNNNLTLVDGYGNLYLENISTDSEHRAAKRQKTEDIVATCVYQPTKNQFLPCEHGWAGVTTQESNYIAIGRFFAKDTHVLKQTQDGYVLDRAIYSSNYVSQCKFFTISKSDAPLLAIADDSQLSIWDIRTSACISRLWRTRGCITDIAVTNRPFNKGTTTFIGVTGTDRDVTVYDCDKWSPRHKWTSVLKYTPSYLTFSDHEGTTDTCYCAGFDNSELKAGDYVNPKKNQQGSFNGGMSGDARWLGVDRLQDGTDTMAGVTQSGSVFLIKSPYLMVPNNNNNN